MTGRRRYEINDGVTQLGKVVIAGRRPRAGRSVAFNVAGGHRSHGLGPDGVTMFVHSVHRTNCLQSNT